MSFNPQNPAKYKGTDKYIVFFVTRPRSPTLADYRQPETGANYLYGTVWQVGKNPTDGVEGDLWILEKIVSNQGIWVQLTSGTGTGPLLTLSGDNDVLVYPTASGNIQLEGTPDQIAVTEDTVNNKLVFSLVNSTPPVTGFTVDVAVPPGVNPVVPDGDGLVTITAAQVTNMGWANVIKTITNDVNQYTITIQQSGFDSVANDTKNGVCHFNSADFDVDPATGFVSLVSSVDGFTWNTTTANLAPMVKFNGYMCIAAGGALTLALPAAADTAIGDTIQVLLDGATSWQITQSDAAHQIRLGSSQTTLGATGTITSTAAGDWIELVAQTSTRWIATARSGNFTIV